LLSEFVAQPVVEEVLGRVNLVEWASGPYLIRLVARDAAGHDVGQCVIQVTLDTG
jgi:hypothetical protein